MIEFAEKADIPRMVEIENECFDTDRLNAEHFATMMDHPKYGNSAAVLVDRRGDGMEVSAVGILQYRKGYGRIYSLAVAPLWRRRGIALALTAKMEQLARIRGYEVMRIEVKEGNVGGLKFWQSIGYKRYGVQIEYYQDNAAAILMEKVI